jgi:hypothetical protein
MPLFAQRADRDRGQVTLIGRSRWSIEVRPAHDIADANLRPLSGALRYGDGNNPAMPFLFLVFGVISVAALGILLVSILSGTVFLFTRFRTMGILVLLIPTLSAMSALAMSWGAAFYCDSMSQRAGISIETYQRWQVLALWAWPLGFVVGALSGAVFATLVGVLIVKRGRPTA